MTTKAAHREEERLQAAANLRRRRQLRWAAWVGCTALIATVVTAMMLSSRPDSTSVARAAPDFTLTDTSGNRVHLTDFRGKNVLLYFSEGAGCQSCLVEMAEIEKTAQFARAQLTVLPIVMNTRSQIASDMAANGVKTPFLLDDGSVATAYGTIGKGMHAGLPGHSFVLIDKKGVQRWYGEYPSMWLAPRDLLAKVREQLAT